MLVRHGLGGVQPVIGAAPASPKQLERRMRARRAGKIILTIAFAVIAIPAAIIMLVAGTSDRRR